MHFNFEIESPYFTFWNETTLILDGWTWTCAGSGGGIVATAAAAVVFNNHLVE
jgi:hypothetical protein